MSIADITDRALRNFRSRVKRLVEREMQAVGCRKLAMKRVAGMLGKSPAWVYRIINEHRAPVQVGLAQGVLAIAHAMKARRPFRFFSAEHRSEGGLVPSQ